MPGTRRSPGKGSPARGGAAVDLGERVERVSSTSSRQTSPLGSPEKRDVDRGAGSPPNDDDLSNYSVGSRGCSSRGSYSDSSGVGSDDSDGERTPTPDPRRRVSFKSPAAGDSDDSQENKQNTQPKGFWDSVMNDGITSLGCGPLLGVGVDDDSPRRSEGRRPRRRTGHQNHHVSDPDVTDDDVMLDLLGVGGRDKARKALATTATTDEETEGIHGYYDEHDATYESELERRRSLRKSLRAGSPSPMVKKHESDSKQKSQIGADGVAFEMQTWEEEKDGEAYPSASAVFNEFRKMITTLRDDRNDAKNVKQQHAEKKMDKLDEIIANPSFLYKLHRQTHSPHMQGFIYICIAAVTVTSGLETSVTLARDPALKGVGLGLSIIFALEAVMKIVSAGKEIETEDGVKHMYASSPGRYFTDPMNVLDFCVVLFSFSDYLGTGFEGGSSLVVLRLLRLLRVLKVITVVPELQVILRGVGAGCRSIFWILLLLSGVVYIYSVLGVLVFRKNDPRNFRDLGAGVSTVLNIVTGECVDYFFINYYGCANYGYDGDEVNCQNSQSQKALACIYFVSLILIVGQIMMSLFIGVITNKMEQAAEVLRETKMEEQRIAKAAKAKAGVFASRESAASALGMKNFERTIETLNVVSGKNTSEEQLDALSKQSNTLKSQQNSSFKAAQRKVNALVKNKYFEAFVVIVIILAGIETGVETSQSINTPIPTGWKVIGEIVVWIFTCELLLKMFVFADKPRDFFKGEQGGWNAFDLAVVIAAFVPSQIDSFAIALRLLRLLRILKLIRAVPQLQVIVTSLIRGTASIFYVAVLMALVFYVYGIAGVHLYRENDPFHFETLGIAFITLFRISMMDDWKTVVHVNAAGCSYDFYGENDGGATYADITGGGVCENSESFPVLAVLYFGSFIIIGALVLVSVFVGIIVTGMQDATEDMNIEMDRLKRAKLSAEYFGIDSRTVAELNRVFKILDIDGGGELGLDELRDAMRCLGVPLHGQFLDQAVSVFANDKTELDEADFLLLVSLCKAAVATLEQSAVVGKPFYGNSEDEREEGEGLREAFDTMRHTTRESVAIGEIASSVAGSVSGSLKNVMHSIQKVGSKKNRAKISVSDSSKNLAQQMDKQEREMRNVFQGIGGMFKKDNKK